MPELGPYAAYVLVSYGVAALVLGALALWAVMADARAQREVRELERRSGRERP